MAAGTANFSSKNLDSNPMEMSKGIQIAGYPIKGLSIGGHETCVIFPTLNLAFDIGRCPQKAISQDFLFISHGHMDHIVSPGFSLCFIFQPFCYRLRLFPWRET